MMSVDATAGDFASGLVDDWIMLLVETDIREGKSPDDKETQHFVLNFLQISTFLRVFPELTLELYQTTAFHHAPLQC
jgi:hypothetical protein